MTRVVTVPQCVMLLLGGGLAVHGLTVPCEVYLINFSCLLAHVVVLSAPLLKWPIVCHCELRLPKKNIGGSTVPLRISSNVSYIK